MTTTEPKTVAGRPVHGEISHYSDSELPEQRPIEEFVEFLDTFFAAGVTHVRWRQYTPYFNDGEPCTFGTGEFYIKAPSLPEDGGDYADGFHDLYDARRKIGEDDPMVKVFERLTYRGDFNLKAFYIDLNKHFGDPAEVTATPEGFDVEFYDHD